MRSRDEIADYLEWEGHFEIRRSKDPADKTQSGQVWLTNAERDEIIAALRGEPETHLRCCGTIEPQYTCPESLRA